MRIGIYSGSFNPIHMGHVALCDYLISEQVVDKVWLIRSPLNPFKEASAQTLAPDTDREAMLLLAIEGHEGLEVSTIEDDLPRPNYSINTFHLLEERYPEHEFYLIIGADNWLAFDRWRAYEEFLSRYHLIVYPRPGYDMGQTERERLGVESLARVRFVDAPQYDISSTKLRTAISQMQNEVGKETACPKWLDERVYEYILNKQLYK